MGYYETKAQFVDLERERERERERESSHQIIDPDGINIDLFKLFAYTFFKTHCFQEI